MKQFGLLGKHLQHSFSEQYFTSFFEKNNIAAQYKNYAFENWQQVVSLLQDVNFAGLNITIPFKKEAFAFADVTTPQAKAIGAINCLKKNVDGKWQGHNTDAQGFEYSFVKYVKPYHAKALILGNGGAAQAVKFVFKKLSIPYVVVSRMPEIGNIGFADVDEQILQQYSIIINCTPLGMHPNVNSLPPIPYQFLNSNHYLFDLVYNPLETTFLQHGKKVNATCINGLEMLYAQADAAWKWFND